MLLEVSATLRLGVNVFGYVVENGRYGLQDAQMARAVTSYLFNGGEEKPNLVIVMTKCTRQQLQFSQQKKAEWLERQSRENQHFRSLYKMVNYDPSRFFMVDNQDEEDMRHKNEKGIKPLQSYVLNIDTTLQWHEDRVLTRLNKLNQRIEYLKSRAPEAMEKQQREIKEQMEQKLQKKEEEHQQDLQRAEEERKQDLQRAEEQRKQDLQRAEEERKQDLQGAEEEHQQDLQRAEEERKQEQDLQRAVAAAGWMSDLLRKDTGRADPPLCEVP